MTEEKLRRIMKYAELIRKAAFISGDCADEDSDLSDRYRKLTDYLIHRMEREMKR